MKAAMLIAGGFALGVACNCMPTSWPRWMVYGIGYTLCFISGFVPEKRKS